MLEIEKEGGEERDNGFLKVVITWAAKERDGKMTIPGAIRKP